MPNDVPSDFVIVSFQGIKLDPKMITECLGIEPYVSGCAGKTRKTPSGEEIQIKRGYWNLQSSSDLPIA